MHRGIIAAAAAVATLALSACGGSDSDAAVTVTETVTADSAAEVEEAAPEAEADAVAAAPGNPEEGEPLSDEIALQLFSELPTLSGWTDDELAEMSDLVCTHYDLLDDEQEATLNLIKALTDGGVSGGDSGAFLVYATGWKCPEHYGKSELLD